MRITSVSVFTTNIVRVLQLVPVEAIALTARRPKVKSVTCAAIESIGIPPVVPVQVSVNRFFSQFTQSLPLLSKSLVKFNHYSLILRLHNTRRIQMKWNGIISMNSNFNFIVCAMCF